MNVDAIQSQLRHLLQKHKALIERKKSDPENGMLIREIINTRDEITNLSNKQRSVLEDVRKGINKPDITQHFSAKLISKAHTTAKIMTGYNAENRLLSKRKITDLRRNMHYNNDQDVNHILPTAQKNIITSVNNIQKVIPAMPKLISAPRKVNDNNHRNQASPLNGSNAPSIFIMTSRETSKNKNAVEAKTDGNGSYIVSSTGPSLTMVENSPRQSSSLLARSPDTLHEFTNNERSTWSYNSAESNARFEAASSQNVARSYEEKHSAAKLEYMAKLGLILPEDAREIERKRDERKRRSKTQGLSSSQEAFQKAQRMSSGLPLKRGRGRPPKTSTSRSIASPPELSSSVSLSQHGLNSINKINTANRAQRGRPRKRPIPDDESSDGEPEEQDDVCCICGRGGELLICDTCNGVYHLRCLDPPLSSIPEGMWMCPECQKKGDNVALEWPGILVVVHSYLKYKADTDEEKERLNLNIDRLKRKIQRLEDDAVILSNEVVSKVNTISDLKKRGQKLKNNYQNLSEIIKDLKEHL